MKKIFFALILAFLAFLTRPNLTYANTAGCSAELTSSSLKPKDNRAEVLKAFLQERNSPMASSAKTFVREADKNNIDWKLVASIAGNESQFGEMIPPYSYNGWGYGVYGTNVRVFSSWDEGIAIVSKAIKTDYIDTWGAKNIYEIGSFYAADPMWANKVITYQEQIDEFGKNYSNNSLSISL